MSLTDRHQKWKEHFVTRSSDSEENYFTDSEGISEQSLSGSIIKLKNISIGKNCKKCVKKKPCKLNVSLRYGKSTRHFRAKNESQKSAARKTTGKFLTKVTSARPAELQKKGKRCLSGGKAKGKPPQEENHDKYESEDESDSCYFGRISLGYFQKFRDKSGASTSTQWEEDHKKPFLLSSIEEKWDNTSEENELLELKKWGVAAFVSSYNNENEKLSRANELNPGTI